MHADEAQTGLLLILGVLFLLGLAADLIGRYTFLPRVTLLLLAGVAIGPAGFSWLPDDFSTVWFPPLTNIALAFIGFLLGQQLSVSAMRQRGKQILGISICKVMGAWLFVATALFLAGVDPIVVLLLAGIAPATAPAATYDLVQESQAEGEFPQTLLSIVAVDDLWGLILFILMVMVAGITLGTNGAGAGLHASLTELGGSIGLGIGLGIPMAYLTGRIRPGEPTLAEALGFVLLSAGIASWLGLLPILTAMAMGATVASLAKHHERPFHAINGIEWPFMILFFILAGAALRLQALPLVGGITALYVIGRCLGIYVGTRIGCRLVGSDLATRRWLGLALFPQAGVALGMALLASQRFPDYGSVVLPVILASTIFLEVLAPVVSRRALTAAGENN